MIDNQESVLHRIYGIDFKRSQAEAQNGGMCKQWSEPTRGEVVPLYHRVLVKSIRLCSKRRQLHLLQALLIKQNKKITDKRTLASSDRLLLGL